MTIKHECKTYRLGSGTQFKYAHAKLDGIWLEVRRHAFTAVVEARTSLPTDITEKLRICGTDWFRQCEEFLPKRGVVYGELFVPDKQASAVSTALAEHDPRISFMPFAALWNTPKNLALTVDSPLSSVEQQVEQILKLPFATWWGITVGLTADDFIEQYNKHVTEHGRYEGFVFKNGNMLDWHKYKPVLTCDCVVLDYTDGCGKYEGQIGALVLGLYNKQTGRFHEVAYASGMDDETRIGITENQAAVVGRVCEVAYQCAGSAGRLRHPRFLRFRDDKAAEDCRLEQLQ